MATRVDLPIIMVRDFINLKIASNKRAMNAATNPLIKEAIQGELTQLANASNTLSDTK